MNRRIVAALGLAAILGACHAQDVENTPHNQIAKVKDPIEEIMNYLETYVQGHETFRPDEGTPICYARRFFIQLNAHPARKINSAITEKACNDVKAKLTELDVLYAQMEQYGDFLKISSSSSDDERIVKS